MAIFYLDGTTLLNSQAVFTDQGLTTPAADGFYSDGTISREQVSSLLLAAQNCGSCGVACGGTLSASASQGVYLLDLDVGGTNSDTGAIVITFDPINVPDGFKAMYNGLTYNKISSPVDGYHASTVATNHTYIGTTASDCGISGSTYTLNEFSYVNGTGFAGTGNTQTITVAAGDVSLSSSPPGNCTAVIPKPTASPSTVNFSFIGPCSGTAFSISVDCPVKLTSFQTNTTTSASSAAACGLTNNGTFFNVPVTGTAGNPALHDWIFSDNNGQFPAADGWYRAGGTSTIETQNGVVINTGTCASNSFFISTMRTTCSDFCTTNYTIPSPRTMLSNNSYANITIGDEVSVTALADGFYAYADMSTNTAIGIFRVMTLSNNIVTSLAECSGSNCVIL
jgi:hypothetical protein